MLERLMALYPELPLLELDTTATDDPQPPGTLLPFSDLFGGHEERTLRACLDHLQRGNLPGACEVAWSSSRAESRLPDLHLLAGALLLAEARFSDAVDALARCWRELEADLETETRVDAPSPIGLATRRLQPSLRLLVRIAPTLLLPLYPDDYAAGLLYVLALWRSGASGEALEVLRQMVREYGLSDELKLVAGQIHLQRGDAEQAVAALSTPEMTSRDSVELARCVFLAYALLQLGNHVRAARELLPSVQLVASANPLLLARARLLLAECYGKAGLLLPALRSSGQVLPGDVDAPTAARMLEHEQGWMDALGSLSRLELEQQAGATTESVILPALAEVDPKRVSKLDVSRDPLKQLGGSEVSWSRRRAEDAQLSELREARDRGETLTLPISEPALSSPARELRQKIEAAHGWWPGRRERLEQAEPGERLARQADEVEHLRVDFLGARPGPTQLTPGERRVQSLALLVGAMIGIGLLLWMVRSCVYF